MSALDEAREWNEILCDLIASLIAPKDELDDLNRVHEKEKECYEQAIQKLEIQLQYEQERNENNVAMADWEIKELKKHANEICIIIKE